MLMLERAALVDDLIADFADSVQDSRTQDPVTESETG